MDIGIIADDRKKELMAQFCIAYCGILAKHRLCATGTTGKYIESATGLKIEKLLSGEIGGAQQLISRIAYDEIDLLLFFRDTLPAADTEADRNDANLLRLCDIHNVPVATNLATAEILVRALDRGDLDWRELINPNSEMNRKRKRLNL
ncbi:MAG TPA: methylglyoxal synthase [Clostridiales bacterium]|nr:methylglyoxal synthase [Clostridiales bacterium]